MKLRDWLACRRKRCDYYKHYLAYGPAELTHEGFHSAMEQCRYWQQQMSEWYDKHTNDDVPEPQHLLRICETWERRVRA